MEADPDELTSWQIEKCEWERSQFNLNRQVGDLRERLEDLAHQNEQLLAELSEQGVAVKEHVNRQRDLEQSRNELANKNLELETMNSRLNIEKGELEAATVSARKEAQTALVESHALKDQLRELTMEKARLSQSVDAARNERQSIELERQQHATEREVHSESKRWLMNEVVERDNRVSSLRLELSNKELEGTAERLQNESCINFMNLHIERLNEKVEMLQFNNTELHKKMEAVEAAKSTEVGNLEEEIRCLQELQKILKNSLEETKNAADHFRDQLDAQEGVIAEVRKVLRENQEEIREKDEELARVRAELSNVSGLNSTDEQPSMLLEQAARRLTELENDNTNLRTTMEELVDAVNANRPHILASHENEKEAVLTAQLHDVQRELAHTKAELEKNQRDYNFVMRRNAELMYAVERQSKMHDPNWSDRDDEQLFLSCAALLQRNVELEADIDNVKVAVAQAAIDAHSEEMARLRTELHVTKKSEEELKATLEHTKIEFESVKERAEHFQELIRDSASSSEARLARLKAEEAVAARLVADATVARLREQADEHKADWKRRELELEERCRAHEASINSAAETSVKLTAMLDAQKANTAAIELEYQSAILEKEQAHEELQKVMVVNEEQERKLVELGKQTLEATDRAGSLSVRVSALEDELQSAKTEVTELRTTNTSQKTSLEKEEQLRTSVIEMSQILARVEAEKAANWNTQLEMLRQERDSHRATVSRLNDQLTYSRNDFRITEQRLERELDVARGLVTEKEEELSREKSELSSLRAKLTSVSDSDASGMTPERLKQEYVQLKNRTQFLETELDTANRKLMEADAARARMDSEQAGSASHCKELEENWKETVQISLVEQAQLRNSVIALEERAEHLTDRLAFTRNELSELRVKYEALEHKADQETSELRRELQMAALNAEGVRRELEVSMSNLVSAQNENTHNVTALEQQESIVGELRRQIGEIKNSHENLQAQYDTTIMEFSVEKEEKKEANKLKGHAEQQLQLNIQELDKLKATFCEMQKEYEEKLTHLSHQYESLSSSQDPSTCIIQSNVIDNFQSLLQSVRQSKEEANQRAIGSELEAQRLRAQSVELEKGRNALVEKIRKLELEKLATNASLIEKAQLIERVELMENVHTVNGKLKEQLSELREQVAMLTAKNEEQRKEMEQQKEQGQCSDAKEKKAAEDVTMKLSQTRRLAIKYRDELAELKKSLKTSPNKDPCARRLAEQSKAHAEQLAEKDAEISELTGKLDEFQQEMIRTALLEKRFKQMSGQLAELRQRLAESTDVEGSVLRKSPAKKSPTKLKTSPQKIVKPIEPLNDPDAAPPLFATAPTNQSMSNNDGLAEPRRKRTASEMERNDAKRTRESSSETAVSSEHMEHTVSDEDHDVTIQPAPDDVEYEGEEEDAPEEAAEVGDDDEMSNGVAESEEVLIEDDSQPSVEEPELVSEGAEDEAPTPDPIGADAIEEHNGRSSSAATEERDDIGE